MIRIDDLKPGDVVQLVSGSPVMTVRGFRGSARPAKRPGAPAEVTRTQVICVVWVQRVGFVQHDFAPEELKLPSPRAPRAPEDAAEEGDDDAPEGEAS